MFRQFIEHSNTSNSLPSKAVIAECTCNWSREVWDKLFNNFPQINYLISVSPPLNGIEIQVLQSLLIGHSMHPGDVSVGPSLVGKHIFIDGVTTTVTVRHNPPNFKTKS